MSQKFYLEREIWSDLEYSLRDHSSVQEDLGWGTVYLLHMNHVCHALISDEGTEIP